MVRAVVLAAAIVLSGAGSTPAVGQELDPPPGPCHTRSWIPRHGMPTAEKHWRFVRLVRCAAFHWWPGHADDALAVAWRESHYNPFAVNVGGCGGAGCLGSFQHHASYWQGRFEAFTRARWFARGDATPWWNARAQVIVSVRMMAAQGSVCPAWC